MNGHKPFGIRNGFEGFFTNDIYEIKWSDVTGWIDQGGSLLVFGGHNLTLIIKLLPIKFLCTIFTDS